MKLYDFKYAASPRRVRIFLAEKRLELPTVQVDLGKGQQFSPEFEAHGAGNTVPVLELDDGTCIGESAAICRYLEELHPVPPLLGVDARDRAIVEMWDRKVEFQGYLSAMDAYRNSASFFEDRGLPGVKGGVPQIPKLAERGREAILRFFAMVDRQLAENEYIAGSSFSVADITLLITVDFARRMEIPIPEQRTNLARWYEAVSQRPSASA